MSLQSFNTALAQVTMVDLMQQHVDGAKKLADEAGLEKAPKILKT